MVIAIVTVAALALIAGLVLAACSIAFAVESDPLVDELRATLPGSNCGACGFSGCDGYAEALAHKGAKAGLCAPGGEQTLKAISALIGRSDELVRNVAFVRCGGCDSVAPKAFPYQGLSTCHAAVQVYGGDKLCPYGCLGYGDCVAVCEYDAIAIKDGVAVVNAENCFGCGKCAAACPKQVVTLLSTKPAGNQPAIAVPASVACHSTAKGAQVRAVCSAGCIGCMKCTKACETGAITVEKFLARIDPNVCTGCGQCAASCPVGCIHPLF